MLNIPLPKWSRVIIIVRHKLQTSKWIMCCNGGAISLLCNNTGTSLGTENAHLVHLVQIALSNNRERGLLTWDLAGTKWSLESTVLKQYSFFLGPRTHPWSNGFTLIPYHFIKFCHIHLSWISEFAFIKRIYSTQLHCPFSDDIIT